MTIQINNPLNFDFLFARQLQAEAPIFPYQVFYFLSPIFFQTDYYNEMQYSEPKSVIKNNYDVII